MTQRILEQPIGELALLLGEDVPDLCTLPGDRPSQVEVLKASGLFRTIDLADISDDQVELAALVLTRLPLVAVVSEYVIHDDHMDPALVMTVQFAARSALVVSALQCGVGIVRPQAG